MVDPNELSILEAFKLNKLDTSTKKLDGVIDKLLNWFKTPITIPIANGYPVDKLDKIVESLEKIARLERKEEKKDDWMDTYKFDLSIARNKEIVPIPFTTVDISSLACTRIDNDFTLYINDIELEFVTTMTKSNYDIKSVTISNSASSGYVCLHVQGKRKKS